MNDRPTLNESWKLFLNVQRHREFVADGLQAIADTLRRRSREHDRSKYLEDEWAGFASINRAARDHGYGTDEYKAALASELAEDGCVRLHYQRNSHHPEFHEVITDMGWLDIVEMVVDWNAAARAYGNMSLRASLPKHRERFGFTDEQWWLVEQVVDWLEDKGVA